MRTTAVWILGSLLLALPAQAGERPSSKGKSALASSTTTVKKEGEEFAGAAYFKSLPADLQAKLLKEDQVLLAEDKTTDDNYAGYIKAVAIFKQPKKRAWELMIEPTKQVQFLPRLTGATAAERPANGELVDFQLKVLFSTYKFRVQHWFYPEQSRIEWLLDKSVKNDIKSQEGYWQLFELDENRTIGEYGTRVETGIAAPKFLQDIFARKDIPKALTGMRKFVDSNGTYKRED